MARRVDYLREEVLALSGGRRTGSVRVNHLGIARPAEGVARRAARRRDDRKNDGAEAHRCCEAPRGHAVDSIPAQGGQIPGRGRGAEETGLVAPNG